MENCILNGDQVNHPNHYDSSEDEIWRDIPNYEGLYQVSSFGRIKSLHYNKTNKEQILSLRIGHTRNNYIDVMLCKDGQHTRFKVHRLVAIVFIPNPNNYPHINHKDENPMNNHVDNLEWCTPSYNLNYGNWALHQRLVRGHKIAKMDLEGNIIDTYDSIREAARKNNVADANIHAVLRGKQHKCGGFKWKKI